MIFLVSAFNGILSCFDVKPEMMSKELNNTTHELKSAEFRKGKNDLGTNCPINKKRATLI